METFLRDLVVEQASAGDTPSAIVHQGDTGEPTTVEVYEANDQEIEITRVAKWVDLSFLPFSPGFGLALHQAIRRQAPDVLHLHLPNASAFWCLLLPSAHRASWVVQWQSDVVPSPHQRWLRWFYWAYRLPETLLLKKASAIIASSPPYLRSSRPLEKWHAKCSTIPLGIASAGAKSDDRSKPGRAETLEVLFVGRLAYYKGLQYLIEAIAKTSGVNLTIAGGGLEQHKLQRLIEEKGLQQRVNMIGACTDSRLAQLYGDCDLFCLPSIERTESFGIVLLEAMRAGVPCAVADVEGSGMAWIVENGASGYVFRASDSADLAKLLQELAGEHDNLKAMGRLARARFSQRFDISRCRQEISRLYQRVLKRK